MNNLKSYLFLFIGFLFSIVNLYSQTNRIDNYYLDHFEKLNSNKRTDINHDQRYNKMKYSRILRHMQNQEFESSFVVDSVISTGYYADKRKYIYSYDTKGNLTSELLEGWDENELISGRSTYTYDSDNNMTSKLREFKFYSNLWDRQQHTWVYDSNNNITLELYRSWNENENPYEYGRTSYTYDSNNNMTSNLPEDWDGNQWVYAGRSTYTYDSDNNMTSELYEWWDENENQWVNNHRLTYTYDSNNNMTSDLSEDWDGNQWVYDNRSTYTYDSINNMTSELYEWWDENENQWVSYWRFTCIYDSNRNLTFVKNENWENGSWVPLYWGGWYGLGLLFNDSFGNEIFVQGAEISIYYSIITEVKNSNQIINNFSLSQNYPNPFNPVTTIKYSIPTDLRYEYQDVRLIVYDILGREVATLVNENQKPGNYEIEFDGTELTSGIYFYRIKVGEFVETKKMILLK